MFNFEHNISMSFLVSNFTIHRKLMKKMRGDIKSCPQHRTFQSSRTYSWWALLQMLKNTISIAFTCDILQSSLCLLSECWLTNPRRSIFTTHKFFAKCAQNANQNLRLTFVTDWNGKKGLLSKTDVDGSRVITKLP